MSLHGDDFHSKWCREDCSLSSILCSLEAAWLYECRAATIELRKSWTIAGAIAIARGSLNASNTTNSAQGLSHLPETRRMAC
jgi:hypothetical protein